MLRVGRGIRAAARDAPSMEEAFENIARYLYDELQTESGDHACALVRCYKTHPFSKLQASQQTFARKLLGDVRPFAGMQCLTLIATAGEQRAWNEVRRSKGHRAIPLPSPEIVAQAPMIAQLIRQFGLDLAEVVSPADQVVRDTEGRSYGVFHVENAVGSPFIPAQEDFVLKYGIRSVVGCGGHLRGGALFAVILFSKVRIDAAAADRFRALALDVKATLFPYDESRVFAESQREAQPARR
jgi:hypothetical protein